MAGPTADALRDALDALSDRLDSLIDTLPPGNPVRKRLEGAQSEIEDASSAVDARSIEALIANNADLQKIADVTAIINHRADQIASSQANVNRIVTIADKIVALGNAVTAGPAGGILSAADALKDAFG